MASMLGEAIWLSFFAAILEWGQGPELMGKLIQVGGRVLYDDMYPFDSSDQDMTILFRVFNEAGLFLNISVLQGMY